MTTHTLFNFSDINNITLPYKTTEACFEWCKAQIVTQQALIDNEIIIGFTLATLMILIGRHLQHNQNLLPKDLNKQIIYLITDGLQTAGILTLVGIIVYYILFQ